MDFWIYLLKVNIAISIFYLLYRMLCRKDTFFQWKRIFLISLILTSLVYPLIIVSNLLPTENLYPNEDVSERLNQWEYTLQEIIITGEGQPVSAPSLFLWKITRGIYLSGVVFLFARLIIQFFALIWNVFKAEKIKYKRQIILVVKENKTPFSFFNWLILDPKQHTEKELDEIIEHEHTHKGISHSRCPFI